MPEKFLNLLFVCIENSNRSQMAEGFARTLGRRSVDRPGAACYGRASS